MYSVKLSPDEYYTADVVSPPLETTPGYPEQLLIWISHQKDSELKLLPKTPSDSVIHLWSINSYEKTIPVKEG